jgi:hypothetical protein
VDQGRAPRSRAPLTFTPLVAGKCGCTTEHFTLQGARSQTIGESAARSSLYMFSVSSTLVALGFVSQVSAGGELFQLFALTVLPTLFFLGVSTFARLVQSSTEDVLYGRAINRIRHYYIELAGEKAGYFLMSGHDDPRGVLANMGLAGARAGSSSSAPPAR